MSQIPSVFRRFIPQLLHVIVLPIFFFTFILVLRPSISVMLLGSEWFGVHLTIMSCIILLSMMLTRLFYYLVPMYLNYTLYTFWCLAEIIFTSFFLSLYLWLVMDKSMYYFEFLGQIFKLVLFSLPFAYIILALSLRIYDFKHKESIHNDNPAQRMRFYDSQHNLKIVLTAPAILYISAEENYVNIFYIENDRVNEYTLRSSMKAIDELCQENGLMRCHRSFYINPAHVKVLRKDKDGIMYAELDASDVRHIPVSKKYYDRLSEML